MGGRGGLCMQFRPKNDLCDPVAVAQVDEDDSAVVAPGSDPSAQGDFASDIGRAQGAAEAVTVVHNEKGD